VIFRSGGGPLTAIADAFRIGPTGSSPKQREMFAKLLQHNSAFLRPTATASAFMAVSNRCACRKPVLNLPCHFRSAADLVSLIALATVMGGGSPVRSRFSVIVVPPADSGCSQADQADPDQCA